MSDEPAAARGFPPVKRREIFGWCCFDFANSAFTTIIITVVYARYFAAVVAEGDTRSAGWWGTTLGVSQLIVLIVSPLVGAIADVTAKKKLFLAGTALMCSLATIGLMGAGPGDVILALVIVAVANVAFALSENICAAFLPEISTSKNVGRISGYGWSFGYFGGLLSLVLALVVIRSGEGRVPWTFGMTGVFFLVAALPTLLLLKERAVPRARAAGETYPRLAWGQLVRMWHELPQHRDLAVFFGAMTLFVSGLMAVVGFAALYAGEVIGMSQDEVIVLFALLQLAGVAGAFGFGFLQDRVGAKTTLMLALVLWVVVCGWAAASQSKGEFYVIGGLAGVALGSLQSASRAVVSTLTPVGRAGEFFGYWGFFGKLAGVIGPFIFGWLATALGYRVAILTNGGFFLAGLAVLALTKLRPVRPPDAVLPPVP